MLIFIDESIIKENEIFFKSKEAKRGTNFPNYFIFGRYTECFALNFNVFFFLFFELIVASSVGCTPADYLNQ